MRFSLSTNTSFKGNQYTASNTSEVFTYIVQSTRRKRITKTCPPIDSSFFTQKNFTRSYKLLFNWYRLKTPEIFQSICKCISQYGYAQYILMLLSNEERAQIKRIIEYAIGNYAWEETVCHVINSSMNAFQACRTISLLHASQILGKSAPCYEDNLNYLKGVINRYLRQLKIPSTFNTGRPIRQSSNTVITPKLSSPKTDKPIQTSSTKAWTSRTTMTKVFAPPIQLPSTPPPTKKVSPCNDQDLFVLKRKTTQVTQTKKPAECINENKQTSPIRDPETDALTNRSITPPIRSDKPALVTDPSPISQESPTITTYQVSQKHSLPPEQLLEESSDTYIDGYNSETEYVFPGTTFQPAINFTTHNPYDLLITSEIDITPAFEPSLDTKDISLEKDTIANDENTEDLAKLEQKPNHSSELPQESDTISLPEKQLSEELQFINNQIHDQQTTLQTLRKKYAINRFHPGNLNQLRKQLDNKFPQLAVEYIILLVCHRYKKEDAISYFNELLNALIAQLAPLPNVQKEKIFFNLLKECDNILINKKEFSSNQNSILIMLDLIQVAIKLMPHLYTRTEWFSSIKEQINTFYSQNPSFTPSKETFENKLSSILDKQLPKKPKKIISTEKKRYLENIHLNIVRNEVQPVTHNTQHVKQAKVLFNLLSSKAFSIGQIEEKINLNQSWHEKCTLWNLLYVNSIHNSSIDEQIKQELFEKWFLTLEMVVHDSAFTQQPHLQSNCLESLDPMFDDFCKDDDLHQDLLNRIENSVITENRPYVCIPIYSSLALGVYNNDHPNKKQLVNEYAEKIASFFAIFKQLDNYSHCATWLGDNDYNQLVNNLLWWLNKPILTEGSNAMITIATLCCDPASKLDQIFKWMKIINNHQHPEYVEDFFNGFTEILKDINQDNIDQKIKILHKYNDAEKQVLSRILRYQIESSSFIEQRYFEMLFSHKEALESLLATEKSAYPDTNSNTLLLKIIKDYIKNEDYAYALKYLLIKDNEGQLLFLREPNQFILMFNYLIINMYSDEELKDDAKAIASYSALLFKDSLFGYLGDAIISEL